MAATLSKEAGPRIFGLTGKLMSGRWNDAAEIDLQKFADSKSADFLIPDKTKKLLVEFFAI